MICKRCVMDTSAKDIVFDKNGICNFCNDYLKDLESTNKNIHINNESFENFINTIKKSRGNSKYDCIVGVSGGVDSSWVLVLAKRYGLKPLAVHMDNGWNSELAQNNIEKLVINLGVDLYTHVINWEEYRELMQAFFDADVVDIELLYDNAMLAVNYRVASLFNIKFILGGTNSATEGMRMPETWNWFKYDKKNIKNIAATKNINKFTTFPTIGPFDMVKYKLIKSIKWVSILDMLNYKKEDALSELELNYGYKRYAQKHYESIFTRFYQGYILPQKFKIDKRRLHYSNLIMSNQLTREHALLQLSSSPYQSPEQLNEDRAYFLNKIRWSEDALIDYLHRPGVDHSIYGSDLMLWNRIVYLRRRVKDIIVKFKF